MGAQPEAEALLADHLRELARALEAGERIDPVERRWLAAAPWGSRRARRDRLLRELGDLFTGSPNGRAERLRSELQHYAGTAWPLDRRRGAAFPPSRRRELLFAVHSVDPNPPRSLRQIRTILVARAEGAGPPAVGND